MYKLSLADFSHKRELTNLWLEAFGDGENFIASFLGAYMIPEYNVPVMISESDKKIASALYLVDFELYSETKSLGNCAYLFAAATKKGHRNKGCMSKLVEYSASLCANRGLKAIFLFPQEQNRQLFEFYSKFGFKDIYAAKKIIIHPGSGEKNAPAANYQDFNLTEKNIADTDIFDGLYGAYAGFTAKQALAPLKDRLFYFKCAVSYLDAPDTHFAVFEYNSEKICYVFYKKYKNTLYIDDIILNAGDNFNKTADILAGFMLNSGICEKNLTLEMNILPDSVSDAQNNRLAMLLPLTHSVKNIVENLTAPVYINMFMNL